MPGGTNERGWSLPPAIGVAIGVAASAAQAGATAPATTAEHGPVPAASVLYVDGDASLGAPPEDCPGDGSDALPFRSLDCAFASGAVRPGTVLQVRDAEAPYGGVDSTDHLVPSGSEPAPIVVEPAPGHAPIFTGSVMLSGLSYWTLRDLVFDGSDGGAPSTVAVRITTLGGQPVVGATVEGVTIRQWPDRGIMLRGTDSASIEGAVVRGNRIEAAQDAGLWIESVADSVIEYNEISDIACVAYAPFTLCDECGMGNCAECGDCLDEPLETCGMTSDHEIGGQVGLRVLGDSHDLRIERNYVHDLLDDDCGAERTRTAAMFITGALSRDSTLSHNFIERVAPGNVDNGYGILMYQSAPGWTLERNVLADIGYCGLCEGDWLFYGSRQSQWIHNTVIGVEGSAIDVRWAAEVEFLGNMVVDAPDAPIRVSPEGAALRPVFDLNLYWGGDAFVGRWGDDTPLDMPSWQAACGCDSESVWDDPGLPPAPPFDPTPAFDGPAIDLAINLTPPYNGSGEDAGALEAPVPESARIDYDSPDIVRLALDNQVYPPLQGYEGCVGFTVSVGGDPVPLLSCDGGGDELQLHLAWPAVGGMVMVLEYAGGSVTDSAAIGGLVGARLRPFALGIDNNAPAPAADDTAGDSTADDGSATGGDDAGGGGNDEALTGCFQCRSDDPSRPAALLWLLLLLRRRSRSSSNIARRAG